MAPTKDIQLPDGEDKILMLKEALKCVKGTLDFEKLATAMGVANAEAMRKRFKRFFEKDEEPIQIKGSTLGGGDDGSAIATAPRTLKTKLATLVDDEAGGQSSPKPRSTGKKRNVGEVTKFDDSLDIANSSGPATIHSDHTTDNEPLRKKAKASSNQIVASAKVPKTS